MNDERPAGHAYLVWKGLVAMTAAAEREPVAIGTPPAELADTVVPVLTRADGVVAYLVESDDAGASAALAALAPGAIFADLTFEQGRFSPAVRYALLRAIAVERWSNRYRFCPACGASLTWTSEAIAKICTNPQRVHRHFPRLDPAIITLVTHGDRALLGRSKRFPPGLYSTLAGFVEAGESVEAALKREVFEETGIRVGATRYFGSESWPFPRSLMLAYFATAESLAITLNDAELEDARWFERDELRALQGRWADARPHFDTIARRLIDTWLTRPAAEALNSPDSALTAPAPFGAPQAP